jgi:Flp pilus assembly protein TadD
MKANLHPSSVGVLMLLFSLTASSYARDLRITIPKHTEATPVQKLNREGVKAVKKNEIGKAEKLFYKAYLLDPDDPFTLNNLGYLSELQGKVERAQKYYQLAAREDSETVIAESSVPQLEGHDLTGLTRAYASQDLEVNRGNIEAMSFFQQARPEEAEAVLKRMLTIDPKNPFTLNNLGLAMEAQGNLDDAVQYYTQAASLHSDQSVVVALDPHVRGRTISEVAESNAIALHDRMAREGTVNARVARLSVQGVTAVNHNDAAKARDYFSQAYGLDPRNAFALNNMGYVSEMNGDQETANDFYSAAAEAPSAAERVALASREQAHGAPLARVASGNDQLTQANLLALQEARRRQAAPIQLRRRDNTPVTEPAPSSAQPGTPQLQPRPPVDNAPVDNAPVVPRVPQR